MPDVSLGAVARGSADLSAYLARPQGEPPKDGWPGVVAIHEVWGLDDVLRRQCDRLAAAGYLTLGPDLYSDGGARRCVVSTMRSLVRGTGKPFADIEAARRWLLDHDECSGRVGVIGFCMGGGFALVTAARGFEVASVNYGQLPRHLDATLADASPVVASYGSRDLLTPRMGQRLGRSLTRLGVEHDVKVYPGAGHSFLNDAPNGPSALRPLLRIANVRPDPEAAADAWRRIEDFFARHLQAED